MKYFDGRYQALSYQTFRQIQIDSNSNMVIPCTLHYFEPIQLMAAGLLRDSNIMQHFVCQPQVKLTTCGERIHDKVTSATWFENAFNNSPASENSVLETGFLFVALTVFIDGSPIDKQMKHSEHPLLLTMLNLTLEGRKKVDGWHLVCISFARH